jgi:hypothetical protein
MSKYQFLSDQIFNDLESGKITRQDFYNSYNNLYASMPDELRNKIKRRMDWGPGRKGRCMGQFALTIYDNTHREKLLIEAWGEMMLTAKNFKSLVIRNTGADNTGRVLIEGSTDKPDYEIEYTTHLVTPGLGKKRKRSLEVKFTGQSHKLTYKVKDLENYIKSDSLVLTIISEGMIGPNGDPDSNLPLYIDDSRLRWFILNPAVITKLLKCLPVNNRYEMGNKPCIQLTKTDFDKYLSIMKWGK